MQLYQLEVCKTMEVSHYTEACSLLFEYIKRYTILNIRDGNLSELEQNVDALDKIFEFVFRLDLYGLQSLYADWGFKLKKGVSGWEITCTH